MDDVTTIQKMILSQKRFVTKIKRTITNWKKNFSRSKPNHSSHPTTTEFDLSTSRRHDIELIESGEFEFPRKFKKKYILTEYIGQGSTGFVFGARDPYDSKKVLV